MSRFQSARRLTLLAGSSFVSVSLVAAGSACVVLFPNTALAQATCIASTTVTNNGGSNVVIAGGTNNPGVTCAYSGAGATVSTSGQLTVSNVAGGNGINLTATGSSSITWDSTLGTANVSDGQISGGNFTSGPVVDAVSDTGSITIRTDRLNANGSTATVATSPTHGIRAISSGGGDVVIAAEFVGGGGSSASGIAGVEARSLGGGDVTVGVSNGTSSRLYGILASATGAGNLSITTGGTVSTTGTVANGTPAVAAISATTGAGLLTINTLNASGGAGTGVLINAGGNVLFSGAATSNQYAIDLTTSGGTTSTLNIAGRGTSATGPVTNGDIATIRAQGSGLVDVNISGRMTGALDLSALTTRATLDVISGGVWTLAGAKPVSSQTGVGMTIANGGIVFTGAQATGIEGLTADIAFTGVNDVLINEGVLVVHANPQLAALSFDRDDFEAETRFSGVERFENPGKILLGGEGKVFVEGVGEVQSTAATDGFYDDVLSMPGVTFVGMSGEIVFDVNLNVGAQTDCTTRDGDGNLAAADCLMLVGGTTEGVTYVTVNDLLFGDRGVFTPDGILLVDVTGGTSAQGHFVVGPNSSGYSELFGGTVDKGVFLYTIVYDEADQGHKLVGITGAPGLQLTLMPQVAQDLWRTSAGAWFDRQADLRGGLGNDPARGMWLRATFDRAERDVVQSVVGAGTTFDFDNSFNQKSYAVTGGFDLLSVDAQDTGFVAGVMAGYAHSEVVFEESVNTAMFDAFTGGVYASYLAGGLFVDAAVNGNVANMDNDVPALGFFPEGTILSTELKSVGAQIEAGWRLPVMAAAFVEPLASASYVRTMFDDVFMRSADAVRPGVNASFEDGASLRASLGARLGLDQDYGPWRAQYSLLGRMWNEFDGETNLVLESGGPEAPLLDEFTGQFSEFGVGVSLYGFGDAFSGFANFGGKFGDDYRSQKGSVGVRVQW
jgi:hypothetical protein